MGTRIPNPYRPSRSAASGDSLCCQFQIPFEPLLQRFSTTPHRFHEPGIRTRGLGHPSIPVTEHRVSPPTDVVHAARQIPLITLFDLRDDANTVTGGQLDDLDTPRHLLPKSCVSLTHRGFCKSGSPREITHLTRSAVDAVLEVARELPVLVREFGENLGNVLLRVYVDLDVATSGRSLPSPTAHRPSLRGAGIRAGCRYRCRAGCSPKPLPQRASR